jgi:ankyrin repeat protein
MAYVSGGRHLEVVQASLRPAAFDQESGGDSPALASDALMSAALIGLDSAVIELIDKGADVNAKDQMGRTPLMEAAFAGHGKTVEVLLERGADLDAQDNDGWTALMEATSKGHSEIVETLLDRGADTNIKSNNGWSALKAAPKANIQIIRLLRAASARR